MINVIRRPAYPFAMLALACAAPAFAAPEADIYLLHQGGDLLLGSFSNPTTAMVGHTPLGGSPSLTSALEFDPMGRLLGVGGTTLDSVFVGAIDPVTGDTQVLVSPTILRQAVPDMFYARALAIAPDSSFYVFVMRLGDPGPGAGLPEVLVHFDAAGSLLGVVEIDTRSALDTNNWASSAVAIRDDGKVLSAEWASFGSGVDGQGRIIAIDPVTGAVELIGNYADIADKMRGMSAVGGTLFVNFGEHGDEIYKMDPYTADFEYVTTVSMPGYTGTAYGFAIAPTPCPADLSHDSALSVEDIAMFAGSFIDGSDAADLNYDRGLSLDDVSAFVTSYLTGCP
ncbi:MAG: GC-type dockerin domain-anchored protein [Phycisphaerales bacterium]